MIYDAVKSLILAAPKEEVRNEIRQVIESDLHTHGFTLDFLDIVKTGRRIWVDVYIISPEDIILPSILAGLVSMIVSVWVCKLAERK